ncbi:MAG: phage shock protein [Patescibacteria group bacterium]|nr:rhodanese-like domain-containing protein [Candidatus Saccharibacteria bacterium]MDQ5963181.1 phage shock protein [Patescibacteria group bacterium]
MQKILANIGTVLAVVLLILGLVAMLRSNQSKNTTTKTSSSQTSQLQTIQNDLKNGAVLLDVRTPEEYNARHAKDATLWPLQDIQAGKLPSSDKSQKYYVYCRSGNRSAQAKEILEQTGYKNIIDLGGTTALDRIGLPMAGN